MSGLDWFPTLVAAAGDPDIVEQLKAGKRMAGQSYRAHLDGYNQLDFIMGKGQSKRNEVYYFAEGTMGALRIGDYKYRFIDQPGGWLGGTVKVDWPLLCNLRLDPFERTGMGQSMMQANWFAYEFWRFVFVQQEVARFAQTFIEFPPLQKPASFNLDAIKEQVQRALQAHHGQ
jgi:arylsulfatase